MVYTAEVTLTYIQSMHLTIWFICNEPYGWSCCEYTVRLGCRTSCHTPNRKIAYQFQILAYASRPALGRTLASFFNTGIRVHQQAACECSFCARTGSGYWHTCCHIHVQCIGRQGLVQTWVCISSCQKHSYCLHLAIHCECHLQTVGK